MAHVFSFVWRLGLVALLAFPAVGQAQSVGIGTSSPNTRAALDISANNKGLLIPRMDRQQRQSIPKPPLGLMVFQTLPDSVGFWYWAGTRWLYLPDSQTAAQGVSATNGLTKTGTAVKLGGTLTEPTTLQVAAIRPSRSAASAPAKPLTIK